VRPFMLVCLSLLAAAAAAQPDLQLLQAPSSPAFVLLGVEPASVERPGDPSDLSVSLLTATQKFSVLPQNYAMGFAPYWLLGAGKRVTFDQWRREGSLATTIAQTLDLSFAAVSRETDVTALGVGLRFSLRRGSIPASAAADRLAELEAAQLDAARDLSARIMAAESADTVMTALEAVLLTPGLTPEASAVVEQAIATRRTQLVAALEPLAREKYYAKLGELAAQVDLRRQGFKLDFAGGATGDFPGRKVEDGRLDRGGAWLTGGYEGSRFAFLGVARWMAENVAGGDNVSSFDAGARVVYAGARRFAASLEGLNRWSSADDTWRASLIVDYDVLPNRTLSVSLGRDFEGRATGNLIAAVQLLMGFGAKRAAPAAS
jgi:hypothetical protein